MITYCYYILLLLVTGAVKDYESLYNKNNYSEGNYILLKHIINESNNEKYVENEYSGLAANISTFFATTVGMVR